MCPPPSSVEDQNDPRVCGFNSSIGAMGKPDANGRIFEKEKSFEEIIGL